MRILYAIQGTGNGHLTRAMEMVPCLKQRAEVDVLLSGTQADLHLPFSVQYRLHGLSFVFGKSGGVDLWKTFLRSRVLKLIAEINSLPVSDYDIVVSDFEPVSAWACNLRDKDCVGLSHQVAVLDRHAPKPTEVDPLGRFILKNYAPWTIGFGYHFQPYGKNIFTPIIRKEIREAAVSDEGHYTVYLPAYDDTRLINFLSRFPKVRWQVFSKHNSQSRRVGNIEIHPIDGGRFVKSMAASSGVLSGAGFETPSEALFLGKKLLVVPMKNQYEQHLNAVALEEMGVPVVKSLKPENEGQIEDWLAHGKIIPVHYPDQTQEIADLILKTKNPW